MHHNSVQDATTSTKTNECKDSSIQANTDGERKEDNTCSKAEKRKPCDELEEETCDELEEETHSKPDEAGNVCRELEEEGIRNEIERGSNYSEHMKKISENLDVHHHFPRKMTTVWTKSWFLDVARKSPQNPSTHQNSL